MRANIRRQIVMQIVNKAVEQRIVAARDSGEVICLDDILSGIPDQVALLSAGTSAFASPNATECHMMTQGDYDFAVRVSKDQVSSFRGFGEVCFSTVEEEVGVRVGIVDKGQIEDVYAILMQHTPGVQSVLHKIFGKYHFKHETKQAAISFIVKQVTLGMEVRLNVSIDDKSHTVTRVFTTTELKVAYNIPITYSQWYELLASDGDATQRQRSEVYEQLCRAGVVYDAILDSAPFLTSESYAEFAATFEAMDLSHKQLGPTSRARLHPERELLWAPKNFRAFNTSSLHKREDGIVFMMSRFMEGSVKPSTHPITLTDDLTARLQMYGMIVEIRLDGTRKIEIGVKQ